MDTQINQFVFQGSLGEFHALAQVFARQYRKDGRWMQCSIFSPETKDNNLPPEIYSAMIHFGVCDDEDPIHLLTGFFVEAIQIPGNQTHLTCTVSELRKNDWDHVVLIWLDLVIFLMEIAYGVSSHLGSGLLDLCLLSIC